MGNSDINIEKPLFLEFGLRLLEARKNMRYSQLEFSEFAGCSQRAYQNYERGERELTLTALKNLTNNLDLNPQFILNGTRPILLSYEKIIPT